MKARVSFISLAASLAAACSTPKAVDVPASDKFATLNPADVFPIVAELSIAKEMNDVCLGGEPDRLSPVLADLRTMNAAPDLLGQVDQIVAETRTTVRDEPRERVCAPDMVAGAKVRAAAAQDSWAKIRDGSDD